MRKVVLLAAALAVVGAGVSAHADPTAPTHTITDEVHGTYSELAAGESPIPGRAYTSVTVDHSRWRQNQPIHDHTAFSSTSNDQVVVYSTTYDAAGQPVTQTFVDGTDDYGPLDVQIAPDLSSVHLSGALHVRSWDGSSYTDLGSRQIGLLLGATDRRQTFTPTATAGSLDLDLGSGWATGAMAVDLAGVWAGTAPGARLDYTDHLVETTS
jgi:YD repeat-containing protein